MLNLDGDYCDQIVSLVRSQKNWYLRMQYPRFYRCGAFTTRKSYGKKSLIDVEIEDSYN